LIDVQFSTNNKLATTQDRQTLQNSNVKQYCQYWILRLGVFTRFRANTVRVEALYQCFSNFFLPSPPFHSRHVVFAPQAW